MVCFPISEAPGSPAEAWPLGRLASEFGRGPRADPSAQHAPAEAQGLEAEGDEFEWFSTRTCFWSMGCPVLAKSFWKPRALLVIRSRRLIAGSCQRGLCTRNQVLPKICLGASMLVWGRVPTKGRMTLSIARSVGVGRREQHSCLVRESTEGGMGLILKAALERCVSPLP